MLRRPAMALGSSQWMPQALACKATQSFALSIPVMSKQTRTQRDAQTFSSRFRLVSSFSAFLRSWADQQVSEAAVTLPFADPIRVRRR